MALVTSVGASLKNTWGFSPQSIPGLQLWLDGADITSMVLSGTSVTQWNDKSGNGYNFTNNGGSTNPTPDPPMGLLFTTTRSFSNSSVPVPSNYTLMLVGNLTSAPSGYGRMININASIDGFGYLGTYNDGLNTFATFTGTGGGAWFDTNANTPTTTIASSPNLSIMEMTVSGTILTPYFNGTTLNAKTNSGSTSSTTGMCLNGILLSSQGVDGHYSEVLLFNSVLTTVQRQQVEGYLATKWGLKANLPTTHPYSAPTRVPVNRPFFPTDIPGCSLWLDGADRGSMVLSGTSVTTWNDKSGSGIVMGGGSPPSYSGSGVNFVPSNFLSNASFPFNLSSRTIFIICSTGTTAGMVLDLGQDGTTDYNTINSLCIGGRGAGNPNGIVLTENYPPINIGFNSATSSIMYTDTWSGTTLNVYNTGNLVSNFTASFTPTSSTSVMIGARWNPNIGGYMTGTINEIILFNTALTTPQRQQIEQYLAWKWNLTPSLPTAHPGKLLPAFGTRFTPKSLGGLGLWLDGADVGSMVFGTSPALSQWNDKSGNGINLTAVNGPTSSGNGVVFNAVASQRCLNTSFSLNLASRSIFLLCSPPAGTGSGGYLVLGPSGNNYYSASNRLGFWSKGINNLAMSHNYSSALQYEVSITSPSVSFTLYSDTMNGRVRNVFNSGSTNSIVGVPTNGSSITENYTPGTSTQILIGGLYLPAISSYLTGTVFEVIIFNTALSTLQRQQVEGYLAWKWGLQSSLPSTHAYAKFSP